MPRSPRRSSRQLAAYTGLAVLAVLVVAVLGTRALPTAPTGAATSAGGLASGPTVLSSPLAVGPGASGAPTSAGPGWRVAFAWHVPVLMYHLVATPAEAGNALPGLVVPPALFAAQMNLLHQAGWRTITAATLAHDMAAGTPPPPRTFVVSFDDGHVDGYTEAFPILRQLGYVATYFVPTGRIGHPGDLSEAQLASLAAAGMEIADHTVTHVALATDSPAAAMSQIDQSAATIQSDFGSAPVTFAYPFGSRDAAVIADVRNAGFLVAFTNDEGCLETPANRFVVPRLRVSPGTSPTSLLDQLQAWARMPTWG